MNQPPSRQRWTLLVIAVLFGAVSLFLWFANGEAPVASTLDPTVTSVPGTATATATTTPSPAPTDTPVPPTETATPTETPSPTPEPTQTPEPTPTPLTSRIQNTLWVGLYGAASGPGLGILGTQSPTDTITTVMTLAAEYSAVLTDTQIIPFFHMVVTVADPFPGEDANYVHRVTTETIQVWIDVGTPAGIYSVLDVQPGHSTITEELEHLEPLILQRGVHLAIDPEFNMKESWDVPGDVIGHMTGAQLNLAQAWLNDVAMRSGEPKVLIIHQFDNRMFSGKEEIVDYPYVDLVWDSDGFGGPGAKIGDYEQYAAEPGFEYGGFKIFYNYDVPVMTPAQIIALEPRPAFVVYQ